MQFVKVLDSQKRLSNKCGIFGGAVILSKKATEKRIEAEKRITKKCFVFELSDREREIVEKLGNDKEGD